jgi:hypothetical protein
VLPAVLFCLPWIVEHVSTGLRTRWGRITAGVTAVAMAGVLAGTLTQSIEGLLGLLAGSWRPTGHAPHDMGVGLIRCGVLGVAVAVAVAATVALGHARSLPTAAWRLPPAVLLPLAYLVPYGASLLLVSQTTDGIFPRYYLPFLPALTCGLLFCTRCLPTAHSGAAAHSDRRSVLGWLLVGFFALRGIAILHDEFADTRTRLEAIALLQQNGVPRERITSKWVIDGWEQIERAGYVNDPRIRFPPMPIGRTCPMTTQTRSSAISFPRFGPTSWWSMSGRSRRATAATSRGFPSRPGGGRRTGGRS